MQSFPPWHMPQPCRCVFIIFAHGLAYSRIVNTQAPGAGRDTAAKSWHILHGRKLNMEDILLLLIHLTPGNHNLSYTFCYSATLLIFICSRVPFPTGMQTRRQAGGQTGSSPGSCRKLRSRTVTGSSPSRAATCSITCSASIVAYRQTPSARQCLDASDK